MKQFITFLAIAVLAVACEKSTIENEKSVEAATQKVAGIVGTWKLVAYWQDAGNGTGRWVVPDFTETITFGEEGSFISSPRFPLYSRGYTCYTAQETQIAFYPKCRETCTRMYQLVA